MYGVTGTAVLIVLKLPVTAVHVAVENVYVRIPLRADVSLAIKYTILPTVSTVHPGNDTLAIWYAVNAGVAELFVTGITKALPFRVTVTLPVLALPVVTVRALISGEPEF